MFSMQTMLNVLRRTPTDPNVIPDSVDDGFEEIPEIEASPLAHMDGILMLERLNQDNGFFNLITEAYEKAAAHQSGMCYFKLGQDRILVISKPEDINTAFENNGRNLDRSGAVVMNFAQAFGRDTLFTIENGEKHAALRQMYLQQLNATSKLDHLATQVPETINHLLQEYSNMPGISLREFCMRLSIDLMAIIHGGANASLSQSQLPFLFDDLLKKCFTDTDNNLAEYLNAKLWNFFSTEISVSRKALQDEILMHYLKPNAHNLNSNHHREPPFNLMQQLADMVTPPNKEVQLDSKPMLDQATFGIFMGQNPTANLLTFALMLLAQHDDVLINLKSEIDRFYNNEEDFKWDIHTIHELESLDRFVKEILRLYPPAMIAQQATERFTVGAVTVRKKDIVLTSPLHTNRLLFQNGHLFDPARWLCIDDLPPGMNSIFGLGPRACPAQKYAIAALKTCIATIVRGFDFTLNNKLKSELSDVKQIGTIRFAHSVHVTFKTREPELVQEIKRFEHGAGFVI